MFRRAFQKGFLTVLYAGGSSPLKIWDRLVVNGHVKRLTDEDVRTLVLEMRGTNVATCYIYTPIHPKEVLGISLPFLVMIIKNLKKYFSFEIQILDDRNMRRRFRVSNYQTTTKVRPFGTTMPIGLNPGWNQIQFNLADFTKRAYGSTYVETQRIQIHANCRIRRIYFCDKLYSDDELPNEYKLFYPCVEEKKQKDDIGKDAQVDVPPPSEAGDEAEQEEMEQAAEEEGEFIEMEAVPMEVGEAVLPTEEEITEEIAHAASGVDETWEEVPAIIPDENEPRDYEIGVEETLPPAYLEPTEVDAPPAEEPPPQVEEPPVSAVEEPPAEEDANAAANAVAAAAAATAAVASAAAAVAAAANPTGD